MVILLVLGSAFILGAIPWSLWIARQRDTDLRAHGSGNLGATNVYRVMGLRWGVLVLLLDVSKGVVAVVMARALTDSGVLPVGAAMAAVIGHMFSPFAGFRGGKGVATSLGIYLGLAPLAGAMGFAVWAATIALCGWVSVASAVGAISIPIFVIVTRDALENRFPWVLGLSILIMMVVVWRHRTNWTRLDQGMEQRIWERKPETPDDHLETEKGAAR